MTAETITIATAVRRAKKAMPEGSMAELVYIALTLMGVEDSTAKAEGFNLRDSKNLKKAIENHFAMTEFRRRLNNKAA